MKFLQTHPRKIALISLIIIFLALIRCITEPIRLDSAHSENIPFEQMKPFLYGATIAAIGFFGMVLGMFFNRYRLLPVIALLTIAGLVVLKINAGI